MPVQPAIAVGSWIWSEQVEDKQTCGFWRAFEVPAQSAVARARLVITSDNSYRLRLDGREIGLGSDWRTMTEYDLTQLLPPGRHVLAIEAFNDRLAGGVLLGFRAELADGQVIEVKSDENWRVVSLADRGWQTRIRAPEKWPAAKVIGAFHAPPWENMPYAILQAPALLPVTTRFWHSGWFQIGALCLFALVLLWCARLMTQLAVQSRSQELLGRERDRIARDIHDDLGAGLTQLVLLGEVAQQDMPPGSEPRARVNELSERARALLGSMDELVWLVNSRRDTLRDFATFVCHYAQAFLRATPIRCRFDVESDLPAVPFDLPIRRNLFLAVKEALNNAAKHSHGRELFVRLHREGGTVRVAIEDDGRGFATDNVTVERNGLTNMRERMIEVGGSCRVISRPGEGCRVEFSALLHRAASSSRGWISTGLVWLRRRKPSEIAVRKTCPARSSETLPT